jgi:hypothetical protein
MNTKSKEWWTATRRCAICDATYTNQGAIGKWQCREHPGEISIRTGRFTCCGYETTCRTKREFYNTPGLNGGAARGCILADHNELGCQKSYAMMRFTGAEDETRLSLHKSIVQRLSCRKDAATDAYTGSLHQYVSRYDEQKSEELLRRKLVK